MIKRLYLLKKGLDEDPSCGCCLFYCIIFILPFIFAIFSGPSSKTHNNTRKSRHSSSYSSGIYKAYEALPDIVDSVYICTSRSSYAFHARHSCGALDRCNSRIAKIPVEKAWKINRRPCELCSRHVKFKEKE